MASSVEDVEQLLTSKVATPIAQLNPDLPDQAARKVHGEVTITWPYSAVTRSFAFLLAEPDFRLRRDKGSVRIQLTGPSAEAVGKWDLGSGDEVTLALDGVEWAKDEEPVRPAGSRVDWQLKTAGKLVLKAILGETSEIKSINIDQPVPIDPPEAIEAVPFAEVDTAKSDDEPAVEEPQARTVTNEYASPIFVKRSRASYGPLFELDLDDELEEDGGRRAKGRKRPRYSVQNRMWRYHEDSDSPEPEMSQDLPSAAREQNSDVDMEDTPPKPDMADGGCQTNETELPPHPLSSVNIPVKSWSRAETSPSFGVGMPRPSDPARTDTGVQASPSRPMAPVSNDRHETTIAQNANPFGMTSNNSGFPRIEASVHSGFGMSQNLSSSTNQGSGQASSLFGTAPNAPSNQGLGQTSSLFGTGPAPTPSAFPHPTNIGSGFGAAGSSLRFAFGQQPQPAFGTSPFSPSQPSTLQSDPHPYPESYLDRDGSSNHAPSAPQNPFSGAMQGVPYDHGFGTTSAHDRASSNAAGQGVPSWPMASQTFASNHAVDRLDVPEDLRSDGSGSQATPPGMIPPEVEDGTRNADAMRQEGLLSRPVYRQGVPQAALPDGEDASAGEEEGSMDSDEQAYNESEKGDDYDLRNYDRTSDDEEGFDEQQPLPDDELLDEDEEHFEGEEEDYDEDDYDEEDYEEESHHPQSPRWPPQAPPQPPVQKEPIVIDLLSDSDDDEPPAVEAPRSQAQQSEPDQFVKYESEEDREERLDQESRAFTSSEPPQEDFRSQQDEEYDEDMADDLDDDAEEPLEEEAGGEHEAGKAELEGSEEEDDESEGYEPKEDVSSFTDANVMIGTINSVAVVEEATTVSPGRTHDHTESVSEEIIEEVITTVSEEYGIQMPVDGIDDAVVQDEQPHPDLAESFQTQPAEMLASFQTHVTAATDVSPVWQDHEVSHEYVDGEIVHEEIRAEVNEEDQGFASQSDAAEEGLNDLASQPAEDAIELFDEDSVEHAENEADEAAEVEPPQTKVINNAGGRRDVPPSPPESQHQEVHAEPKVDISMTTVTSHVETQFSDQQLTVFETQDTELALTQPVGTGAGHMDAIQEKDTEMVDAGAPAEGGSSPEGAKDAQRPPVQEAGKANEATDADLSEAAPEPAKYEIFSESSPQNEAEPPDDNLAVRKRQSIFAQTRDTHSDEGEGFQDTSQLPEVTGSSPVATQDANASIVTADSQASETHETDEAMMAPTEKPKRGGRKTRMTSSSKSAKSATVSKRGQRQPSSQQAPSSQRTTRSKTMSFQTAASPKEEKEDMSIQLARAALKSSPSTKSKRKVSAATAKRLNTDLTKRLENDMPDCAPLKDLQKYHSRTLDIAAVATSAHTQPKRTVAREYASSFTITDHSLAPDAVVEVDLYSLHRDHLPIVSAGGSVLLRGFTVVSLPGRGFGLKTDKNESSWAVFEADGGDEPQTRAAPVEMNEKETKFLLDLRAWYAGLDEGAREKLGKAVGEVIENGRESRAKK